MATDPARPHPDCIDRAIGEIDVVLRTLAGTLGAARTSPAAAVPEARLSDPQRMHAAALMRVNHCGEVCAQALYQGQALASREAPVREALARSAREERDHLAWSEARIRELGGRPSVLNPLWYAGSFLIGYAAGVVGERWNLAFLAETERQVEAHLTGHLERLPDEDLRTRVVIEAMRDDEAKHREVATELGAVELPQPVREGMRLASRVMTGVSYYL